MSGPTTLEAFLHGKQSKKYNFLRNSQHQLICTRLIRKNRKQMISYFEYNQMLVASNNVTQPLGMDSRF